MINKNTFSYLYKILYENINNKIKIYIYSIKKIF
jgi:hypothetical protein